jgi:hypothetical protein
MMGHTMTIETIEDEAFRVEAWTPRRQETLRGYCRVILPNGMVFCDVRVHAAGKQAWAKPAGRALLSPDGTTVVRDGERIRHMDIVGFISRDHREAFSRAVISALLDAYPDALD